MGPASKIYLKHKINELLLLDLHMFLADHSSKMVSTRKGKVWDIWVGSLDGERPFSVSISDKVTDEGDSIPGGLYHSKKTLSAGCNQSIDHQLFEKLCTAISEHFVGFIVSDFI